MPLHTINFDLNDMCFVTCNVLDGYFIGGTYTNKYPFPLNLQVVDTSPPKGGVFYYTIPLLALKTDEPLETKMGVNVESLYAKIALARS